MNSRQLSILKWIAAGCPSGVMTGDVHKTSAAALQNRRLVRVSRKGGGWSATLTEAGERFLANGEYPPGHWPQAAPSAAPAPAPAPVARRPKAARPPLDADSLAAAMARRPPTEELLDEIVAAGGELRLDRRTDDRDIGSLMRMAIRYDKVPAGKLLFEDGPDWRSVVLRLVDAPPSRVQALIPVTVPAVVRSLHPAVTPLRQDDRVEQLTRSVRSRALRILHTLARAAEAAGYGCVTTPPSGSHSRSAEDPLLHITVDGHSVGVNLTQQFDRVPHERTASERRQAERGYTYGIPTHDRVPNDRLTLTLSSRVEYRQSTWKDSKRTNLDDVVVDVLREIEIRAHIAERARLARERAEAERRRQWETAMQRAKAALVEQHRAEEFAAQAARWQHARLLRGYLSAMTDIAREDDAEAAEWIAWCTGYADRHDPLHSPLKMPDEPEPAPPALQPFLEGWSAYGPDVASSSWR